MVEYSADRIPASWGTGSFTAPPPNVSNLGAPAPTSPYYPTTPVLGTGEWRTSWNESKAEMLKRLGLPANTEGSKAQILAKYEPKNQTDLPTNIWQAVTGYGQSPSSSPGVTDLPTNEWLAVTGYGQPQYSEPGKLTPQIAAGLSDTGGSIAQGMANAGPGPLSASAYDKLQGSIRDALSARGISFEDVYGSSSGGGGGGYDSYSSAAQNTPTQDGTPTGEPVEVTWSEKYKVENAPDWWKGKMPSMMNAESEYASLVNAMIPYLSPEDQRTVASNLSRMYPDSFGDYDPEKINFSVPSDVTPDIRDRFTSAERGQELLGTLDKFAAAAGGEYQKGPGYEYLRDLGDLIRDYGGGPGQGQTRTNQRQFLGALDPLLAESKSQNLAAFNAIANMLSTPFFSAGELNPILKTSSGQIIHGLPNPEFMS